MGGCCCFFVFFFCKFVDGFFCCFWFFWGELRPCCIGWHFQLCCRIERVVWLFGVGGFFFDRVVFLLFFFFFLNFLFRFIRKDFDVGFAPIAFLDVCP